MKVLFLYKDRDADLEQKLPWNEGGLTQDLELNTLFNAMASGDDFLLEVVQKIVLYGLNNDLETILYRQNILKDCLQNPSIIKAVYDIAVEAIESRKSSWYNLWTRRALARHLKRIQILLITFCQNMMQYFL